MEILFSMHMPMQVLLTAGKFGKERRVGERGPDTARLTLSKEAVPVTWGKMPHLKT